MPETEKNYSERTPEISSEGSSEVDRVDRESTESPSQKKYTEETREDRKKKTKESEVSQKHDELIAERLGESPNLKEVMEKLGKQVLEVKKFFDGSYHQERAKQKENKIIMISELQKEIDKLNEQIKVERDDHGMIFRATDLWGAINDMPITPDTVTIRFCSPREDEAVLQYQEKRSEGALYSGQSMHLSIDADGFSIINEKETKDEPVTTAIDTLLFSLNSRGKIDKRLARSVRMNFRREIRKKDFIMKEIVQRAKEYGFSVYVLDEDKDILIAIDLQSADWKTSEKRYLDFSALEAHGEWIIGHRDIYLSDKPPPDKAKLE